MTKFDAAELNQNTALVVEAEHCDVDLMLFDLVTGGHHGSYIRHLVEHWDQHKHSGTLNIVVSPSFLEAYTDIVRIADESIAKIHIVAISEDESASLQPSTNKLRRLGRVFREWQLLCRYAELLQVSHCLIMYIDTCWLPIALGMKAPCSFSGIYFRPTLHYEKFNHYVPSKNEWVQRGREKFILTRALKHPQLQTLFSLDPFSVEYITQFIEQVQSQARVVHLPDPIQAYPRSNTDVEVLRKQLAIDPNRKVFLLFGALTSRKGIDQLLAAVKLLPMELCQQLCLVLLGEGDETQLKAKVADVCQSQPAQIIEQYQFASDQEVQAYFNLTDVVLALYQKHVGMSGILLWAAAAQKPVLSSNYGLMGELVHQYDLGLAIDASLPEEIMQGLSQCLLNSEETSGNPTQMQAFADSNSVERFTHIIYRNTCDLQRG